MAHNPVGINSALPITSGASRRGVDTTSHQSEYLRVVAKGAGAHVAIGTLPTAAVTNYFVHSGEAEVISLGKPQSNRVTGVSTTGSTVVIDFAEGTGSPFGVGDAVSLTVTLIKLFSGYVQYKSLTLMGLMAAASYQYFDSVLDLLIFPSLTIIELLLFLLIIYGPRIRYKRV